MNAPNAPIPVTIDLIRQRHLVITTESELNYLAARGVCFCSIRTMLPGLRGKPNRERRELLAAIHEGAARAGWGTYTHPTKGLQGFTFGPRLTTATCMNRLNGRGWLGTPGRRKRKGGIAPAAKTTKRRRSK